MSETPISRKGFFTLSGAVGGVLATTGVWTAEQAAATPRSRARSGPGTGGPLLSGEEFPIGVFWAPPPTETTVARYQQMAAAGFTYLHSSNYLWADVQISQYVLRIADQVGLKVLVDDPDLRWLTRAFSISEDGGPFTLTRTEATTKLREIIARYQPVRYWSVEDGRLLVDGGTGDGSIGRSVAGEAWTDYTFSFDTSPRATGAGGYAQAGWAFRITDERNAYVWLLTDQPAGAPGTLVKAVFVDGVPQVSSVPLEIAVVPGQTYRIETVLAGDTVTTSVDGVVVDTTTDATYGSGPVGFREAGSESAYFDDVRVVSADGRLLLGEDFSTGLDAWVPPTGGGFESFAGLHVYDEPVPAKLVDLGEVADIVRGIDPDVLPYINHFPNFDYEAAMAATTPELLSFDRYPILDSGEDLGYFQNWADVRAAALPTDTPTWAFVQSVGYDGHAVPTAADLLWQVNVCLAYGCRGIQYFTYWTPDPARGEGFTQGIVEVDGTPTPLYEAAREVNTGWLAPVGRQLLTLTSTAVQAANLTDVPPGLEAFAGDDEIDGIDGDPVVLGRFDGPSGQRYLLAVNYSRTEDANLSVRWGGAIAAAAPFDPATQRYRSRGRGRYRLRLAPGAAQLVRLDVG